MKETLILIVFIIVFYIVFIMNDSSLVKFNVNGDYVFVRDTADKKNSAELLNERNINYHCIYYCILYSIYHE